MYQSCKKKSNLTLFYTSLPNQEGLSGGEVGSLDILILKAMIIETRSKKDLMRGGGLCYIFIVLLIFTVIVFQSFVRQHIVPCLPRIKVHWNKIILQASIKFYPADTRGKHWYDILRHPGFIGRPNEASTGQSPSSVWSAFDPLEQLRALFFWVFDVLISFNEVPACFPHHRIYETLFAYKESRYNRHYQHKCKNGCNRPKTPIDPKLLNWREKN